MTGYAELEDAIDAINRGQVYHYLLKPWRTEELLQILRNAAEKRQLEHSRDRPPRTTCANSTVSWNNASANERATLQDANQLLEQRTRELERLALTDPLTAYSIAGPWKNWLVSS